MDQILLAIKKHKVLSVSIVVILVIFFQDDVRSFILLNLERFELPHYRSAQKIDDETFQKIKSDFSFFYEKFGEQVIYDKIDDTYYRIDGHVPYESSSSINLQKYVRSTTSEAETFIFQTDERFAADGGLACFSCGCSCYVDRTLIIAGGERFFISSGKNFAMSPERQGLYYQEEDGRWLKLTPKLNDLGGTGFDSLDGEIQNNKVKIFNNGCSIAYPYNREFYQLNVCTKPEGDKVKKDVKQPEQVVRADEYTIEVSVDTAKKYEIGSSISISWKWSGESKVAGVNTWVGFMFVNEGSKREFFLTDALWDKTGTINVGIPKEVEDAYYERIPFPPGEYRIKAFIYGSDNREYPSVLSNSFEVIVKK